MTHSTAACDEPRHCKTEIGTETKYILSGLTFIPDPLYPSTVYPLREADGSPMMRFSKWDFWGSAGYVRPPPVGGDTRAIFGSVDGTAGGAVSFPANSGCTLEATEIRELWLGPNDQHTGTLSLNTSVEHTTHAYALGTSTTSSLLTRVSWRQNMFARCSFQVAWRVKQTNGVDCLGVLNGLTGANGVSPVVPIAQSYCTGNECIDMIH